MSTITIDLDSLSIEKAEKLAGFILAYAGAEEAEPAVKASDIVKVHFEPSATENVKANNFFIAREPSAAEVFSQPSVISSAGPTLVIPNPPQAAAVPAPATQIPSGSAPAPVTAAGVVVDKSGLPWDTRIHSSAKSFNTDGSWRARRGLPEGYVPRIEAELRQLMAIPSPQSAPGAVAQPTPETVVNPSVGTVNIPLPPATASPGLQPYLDLMNKVSSALAGARITSAQLQKVCDAVGLPNFVSLGTRLDLVPSVAPMIEGILAGTAV